MSSSQNDPPADGHPRVWFTLPQAFTRLPSPVDEPADWDRYLDGVRPDGLPQNAWDALRDQYTAVRTIEGLNGVVGAAVCIAEVEDRFSMGYLTVSFVASRHTDPVSAAEGIYRVQTDRGGPGLSGAGPFDSGRPGVTGEFTSPGRLVLAAELPVGPAVAVLTRQVVAAPPSDLYPDEVQVRVGMAQVFVPAPGRPFVAVLTLVSPTPQDFDEYARVLGEMACTVRFDEPAAA